MEIRETRRLSIFLRFSLRGYKVQAIFNKDSAGRCATAPQCAAVVNPTALYRGENNANNATGTNNGTLLNGATFAAGKVGQAFSFDGVNDAITFGNTLGNFGVADFAIDFWLKTSSARQEAILNKRAVCNHGSFWDVRLRNGKLLVELDQPSGVNYNVFDSARSVNDGVYHHIALVRQGANVSLYIDGALDKSQATAAATNLSNTANLTAGVEVCVGVDGTRNFTGQLDELAITSRALTLSEVQALFNAGGFGRCLAQTTASLTLAGSPSINGLAVEVNDNAPADVMTMLPIVGQLLISQARLSGPGGVNDWYVELFNNSALPTTTTGLLIGLADPAGRETATIALTPGRVIAPHGYYLMAGSAARLKGIVPDERAAALPFAQTAAAGLFAGKIGAATRLDALGTNSLIAPYFYENTPLPFLDATVVEYAFVRRLSANGLPQDTQNNAADFVLIAPTSEAINGHATVRAGLNPRNSLMLPLRR